MFSSCGRVLHTAFEMLELDEGKLSRPVLRRGGERNLASLSRRTRATGRNWTSPTVQQRHHVAAKVLGAGDKVIEDTHNAFEAVDCGQLIEVLGHRGVAAPPLAQFY